MNPITDREAYARLSRLCAQAEHCEQEVLEKMRRWGLSDQAQAAVMKRLNEGRFVDNRRYAEAFVRDKARYNQWGPRKIQQALRQKHISDDIIAEALQTVEPSEYLAILQPLLSRKQRTTTAQTPGGLQQKLLRFAIQRGFTFEQAKECLSIESFEE